MSEFGTRRFTSGAKKTETPAGIPEIPLKNEVLFREAKIGIDMAKQELADRQDLMKYFDGELERDPSQAAGYTTLYFENRERIQQLEEKMGELEMDLEKIRKLMS